MNHVGTTIAVSALALSAIVLHAAQGSAQLTLSPGPAVTPDCHWSYHPACHNLPKPVLHREAALASGPSQGNGGEIVQLAGSALGGAGLALGAVWIHRRRRAGNGPSAMPSAVVPPGDGPLS